MIVSSARSGGQASSIEPSSKYCRATRCWASVMFWTPSTNASRSCVSGRRNASSKTSAGLSKTRPKNVADELGGDPVAQPAGQHRLAVVLEVVERLEVARRAIRNAGSRSLGRQPAPDLRDQQADVVIDLHLRADVAGGRGEAAPGR